MPLYEPFVNPYGASIADTIARSGDAQAHAAEMIGQANARAAELKAQAWGGAVQNIAQIPGQIQQQKNAQVDSDLKRQALQQGIDQKQSAVRQRVVMTAGQLAAISESSDEFKSGIDHHIKMGDIPAPMGAQLKQWASEAGPDGWKQFQGKTISDAQQYIENVKLGKDEVLAKPSMMPGKPATVVARGVPSTTVLRPGDVGFQDNPDNPNAPPQQAMAAPFAPGTGIEPVNGQLMNKATGAPVGAAVPKQEGASEVALNAARVDEINKKIEEVDNQIAGTMPISAKDRAELAIQRQRLEAERLHYKTIENGQDINSPKNQEHLEQSYSNLLKTTQSSRSGGLGLEDKKVDQAKHLLTMMDQQKDASGNYHITPTQQTELSIGLATLLSPNGQPAESTIKSINQATAEGDLAKAITYVTGTPVKGTPQDLAQLMRDSIERQGVQAETNREGHFNQLRAFAPTDLAPERRERLEKGLIGANRLSVEVDVPGAGVTRFPTQTAADKFMAEARAKGLIK